MNTVVLIGLGETPTEDEANTYIQARGGRIKNICGEVVADSCDEGSKNKANPCGTYNGHKVIGWKKAQKLGFVKLSSRDFSCPCCEIEAEWRFRPVGYERY